MCALTDTPGHLLPSTVKSFIPQQRGVSIGTIPSGSFRNLQIIPGVSPVNAKWDKTQFNILREKYATWVHSTFGQV